MLKVLYELFCGTKSIGKVFEQHDWTVVSVDVEAKFNPTICCDIRDLAPEMLLEASGAPPDAMWLSPPCTHYSIARSKAKAPRDLALSDSLVQAGLDLAAFFGCPFWMENPYTGLLKTRAVVAGIPMRVLDYCRYAEDSPEFEARYRKRTAIWTNTSWYPARALCLAKNHPKCQGFDREGKYRVPSQIAREIVQWLEGDGGDGFE